MKKLSSILILSILLFSCSGYNKILKSKDASLKLSKAHEFYEKQQWERAATLFEELIPAIKYTPKGEQAYYRYAMAHYEMKDYYLAAFYLKNYSKQYPLSPRSQDARFLSVMCKVKNSPEYSLDQNETNQALDELQLFIDEYPESKMIDTCNIIMDRLTGKLEFKQYKTSKMYYRMENYRAAVTSLKSTMQKFPNSQHKEEVLYMLVKSSYLLAKNSIESKKLTRYEDTIKSYHNFVNYFPDSDKIKELEKYFYLSKKFIEKKETVN